MKRREIAVLWISGWAPLLQNPEAWGFGVWRCGTDQIAVCLREGSSSATTASLPVWLILITARV